MIEMQRLSSSKVTKFYWIQSKVGKPIYELRAEEELFGTLRWSTHVGFDPAIFVSIDSEWKIITDWWPMWWWLWPPTVHITNSGGDVAVCRQERKFSLTRTFNVEFANSRRFRWRTNFWLTRSVFTSENNEELLILKLVKIPQFQLKIQVDVVKNLEDLPEALLLAALGLYIWFATAYHGGFGWFGW